MRTMKLMSLKTPEGQKVEFVRMWKANVMSSILLGRFTIEQQALIRAGKSF